MNRVIWTGTELVAVGSNQTILRSVDDGLTWQPASLPPVSTEFFSLGRIPSGGLVAAGKFGVVLLSFDGGASWTTKSGTSAGNVEFRCVVPAAGGLVGITGNAYVYHSDTLASGWQLVSVGNSHTISGGLAQGDRVIGVGPAGFFLEYDPAARRLVERGPWTGADVTASRTIRGKVWVARTDGGLMLSRDGGTRWEHRKWEPTGGRPIQDISETATGMLAACSGGVYASHDDGETWQYRAIDSTVFFDSAIAAGGQWLAAGPYGRIHRSSDQGTTWTYHQHSGNNRFYQLETRGSRVVAVGSGGVILTSDDSGLTWIPRNSPVTTQLNCVLAVSDSVWIAGGDSGVILRSGDGGTSWTRIFTSVSDRVVDFCKTPTAVIAATRDTDVTGQPTKALWSTNSGSTWTAATTGSTSDPRTVVWTGEKILLMGDGGAFLEAPASGFPWTPVIGPNSLFFTDVEWADTSLFAVGKGGLLAESADHGVTWKFLESGTTQDLEAIAWTGSALIVVGRYSPSVVRRSINRGLSWSNVSGSLPNFSQEVAHGNGLTLLAGTVESRTSVNHGQTWTTPTSSTIPTDLGKFEWANGYFYAVPATTNRLYRSQNGSSWTTLSITSPRWRITAMGSRLFGATSTGLVGRSDDSGTTWQSRQALIASTGIRSIEWTGRHLVATGGNGELHLSGETPPADYLAWAAATGLSGAAAAPAASLPGASPNLFAYVWDLDGDGILNSAEKENMPRASRDPNTGTVAFSFVLPPADRQDLVIALEKMLPDGSWTRVARKAGARGWQGSLIPVESAAPNEMRRMTVAASPGVEPRAFYRLAFEFQ